MTFDEFRELLDAMRQNLEKEKERIDDTLDSSVLVNVQLAALKVVEESAFQMADNGEVFEV